MSASKVNIAIPTYNRAHLLALTLTSVLQQDYADFEVTILDNASTDNTAKFVSSIEDLRVKYHRNPHTIGMFRNWNRAIETNSSMYLCILGDDDLLLPGFISDSVAALDQYPHAGFSTVGTRAIDIDGTACDVDRKNISDPKLADLVEGFRNLDPLPAGVMEGPAYLHGLVAGKSWLIHASSVMIRSETLRNAGKFDNPHYKYTIDINLFNRLASCSDVVVIPKILCEVRFHCSQETLMHYDAEAHLDPVAVLAERMDAIAYLLQSPRAAHGAYRNWLAERLLDLGLRRSLETQHLIPALNYSWSEQLETARRDLQLLLPAGESFILVDEDQWRSEVIAEGRRPLPFLERGGQYWGPPPDDATAILEVERMRTEGANFMVFGWPAFWWLDCYGGLRDHLSSNYHRVARNSRMVVFDLRSPKALR
jgi:glycosyltransferase involved in cell wall biosynthesis